MYLLIMVLLIASSLYILANYGITKSKKAESLALIVSLLVLVWASFCIISQQKGLQFFNELKTNRELQTGKLLTSAQEGLVKGVDGEVDILGRDSIVSSLYPGPALEKTEGMGELVLDSSNLPSFQTLFASPEKSLDFSSSPADSYATATAGILPTEEAFFLVQNSYDPLSLIFVLLTVVIVPITILGADQKTEMVASLLLVEALLIGAFVTLDFISFYALFESVLIPMFFLIGGKGSGKAFFRSGAAYRLFLYTLWGSVLMLLALITLYLEMGSTNWYDLVLRNIEENGLGGGFLNPLPSPALGQPLEQPKSHNSYGYILFPLIFVAFAVKVPMIPVHLWLPEAHTLAPTSSSMILAALLLKLGGYGILRWLIPLFPVQTFYYQPLILVLAAIGTIYACFSCLRQVDIKRIIAYSSITHINLSIFALFTLSPVAVKGSIFEMFSHGLISAALFFLIGVVYNRYDTRILKYFRGLASVMPLFSLMFFLFILGNMGVPLTSGFIGEYLMLSGSLSNVPILTVIVSLAMIFNAGYNIWLFNRMAFGQIGSSIKKYKDLKRKEFYLLLSLIIGMFGLGLCPNTILFLINDYEL